MNKLLRTASVTLLTIGLLGCASTEKDSLRFFDEAGPRENEIRLVVLYPSAYPLDSLINLRDIGFFTPKNLTVIGVFHENERTEYRKAIEMVRKNELDWIRFHRVSGDIHRKNLFEKNPLTPEFEKIFRNSDGVLFFGGADIPPTLYGERTELLTSIRTPYRHFLELSLAFHLLGGNQDPGFTPLLDEDPDFPVLGICLGEQTLNVGTGGDMIQDVWSEVYGARFVEEVIALPRDYWHTNPHARLYPEMDLFSYFLHPVKLAADGFFVRELGFEPEDTPRILSAHHQAADTLGRGFRAVATSLDGKVVEAIHHQVFPNVLGTQFHPEFPILYDSGKTFKITPDDPSPVSARSILESHPPSMDFHRAIWRWFEEKLEGRRSR